MHILVLEGDKSNDKAYSMRAQGTNYAYVRTTSNYGGVVYTTIKDYKRNVWAVARTRAAFTITKNIDLTLRVTL